ncbi:MAG: hypothetical protein AB1422_09220 [bacterium]
MDKLSIGATLAWQIAVAEAANKKLGNCSPQRQRDAEKKLKTIYHTLHSIPDFHQSKLLRTNNIS